MVIVVVVIMIMVMVVMVVVMTVVVVVGVWKERTFDSTLVDSTSPDSAYLRHGGSGG